MILKFQDIRIKNSRLHVSKDLKIKSNIPDMESEMIMMLKVIRFFKRFYLFKDLINKLKIFSSVFIFIITYNKVAEISKDVSDDKYTEIKKKRFSEKQNLFV